MSDSSFLKKARLLLEEVKGVRLSREERCDRSIALASLLLEAALEEETPPEKKERAKLCELLGSEAGKRFVFEVTDQCFRTKKSHRLAHQLLFLHAKYRAQLRFSSFWLRFLWQAVPLIGKVFPFFLASLVKKIIRAKTRKVILPGEEKALKQHLKQRKRQGVLLNLNRLGEAILGEEEARRRLELYLIDLQGKDIDAVSIKISTLYSQIHLLSFEETLETLASRLRLLYRQAMSHPRQNQNGVLEPKCVYLDMEEYKDLRLTVALFKKVLEEPEFDRCQAGIVLQSYLPDSFAIQKELTLWAMARKSRGALPIKIRVVKGANLAMERVEAALKGWEQAPYLSKRESDANYKRMIAYGCEKAHAEAAHIGVATHNLFDIAYALVLREEEEAFDSVSFEMLEGMAEPIRRVIQKLSTNVLLYSPAAKKREFQAAVAYLMRRLDENTAPDNFLRSFFDISPHSPAWQKQEKLFRSSCFFEGELSSLPRRQQNRLLTDVGKKEEKQQVFVNEPDTDGALPHNREWIEAILMQWRQKKLPDIPLVIGGKSFLTADKNHKDCAGNRSYLASRAGAEEAHLALSCALSHQKKWARSSLEERKNLLKKIAQELSLARADLIGALVTDVGKTVVEADAEVSEAIDFANYYSGSLESLFSLQDIAWESKGVALIAPPWNFPCSIAAGGILGALAAGNSVIFKPSNEAALVGFYLAEIFWRAAVPKELMQFILCDDEPIGSLLVQDPRVSLVVLTGSTETAKHFLRMRPDVDLIAETGGKNILVITAMADRDLAIKDLVYSAFGYAGQKCSACSLAIVEAEVYDDPYFLRQLKDAAQSLIVGPASDLKTRLGPLIRPPQGALKKGLLFLEEGEEWLLKPEPVDEHQQLWTPGIKLAVKPHTFTFETEFFGPLLGIVRAASFAQALDWINETPYGLTAGLHSLDPREHKLWLEKVEAGNCYINRTITGAVVGRQPFGGCKASSFGRGFKAGGSNYLIGMMRARQQTVPQQEADWSAILQAFSLAAESLAEVACDRALWRAALSSYSYFWNAYFSLEHDGFNLLGESNKVFYRPHAKVAIRGEEGDSLHSLLRLVAAGLVCGGNMTLSLEKGLFDEASIKKNIAPYVPLYFESIEEFAKRVEKEQIKRVRLLQAPQALLLSVLAKGSCLAYVGEVLANGRIELLSFLREVSVSYDYHRYGNV